MENKKAPPLSRQELAPQLVTEMDAFTALQYLRQREQAPKLWELETNGAARLPGTAPALADMYGSLWSAEPDVKTADQVRPDRRYWQGLLAETIKTPAYQELHATTEGSSLLSLVGTIEAGETILKLVPKEDGKKLQELNKAQGAADESEGGAQEAEAEADQLQSLAEEMMQAAQPSSAPAGATAGEAGQPGSQKSGPPSGGQGQMTAGQAQALADKLAEQWADAQAKAEAARAKANDAKAKADALAEALMGKPGSAEAERKLTELKRLGLGALQKAQQKVSEVSETIDGWGLEEGELAKMPTPEALGLLERMRRSAAFKAFAKLLGRLRAIAAKKARSKTEGEGRRVTRQETGRDIGRVYPSELASLVHPATHAQGLVRWARGELLLRGQETKKPMGHGPVVVCEDASGSMDGVKQQWAKGVVLSIAHFTKLRRRTFGWVMFDSSVQKERTFPKGALSAKEMLEIAESRSGGGTDFERPLRKAVEMIERQGLKKADVVLVTDGDCAMPTEFLEWLRGKKQQLEFSVVTVLCDSGDHVSDATVKQFSDRVERASAFSAEEAEQKVFVHL